MAFFCDILVMFLAVVSLFINADWIPFEELADMILPYVKFLYLGMAVLLALKYTVYEVRKVGDLKYEEPEQRRPYYILMGAYPLLDLARTFVALGILSAMIRGMAVDYIMFNAYAYHMILGGIVVICIVMNYFCYHTQTLLRNAIPTAVFFILTVVFSKGLFLKGLGDFFTYSTML